MENESIGQRRMGINYTGSQGQAERAVVLQEEEERHKTLFPQNLFDNCHFEECLELMTTKLTLHDKSSQLVQCHDFSLMGP